MRMNCEIHLTFHISQAARVAALIEAGFTHWKFSEIQGDPVMGAKPFCYLTTYADDAKSALSRIEHIRPAIRRAEIQLLREKIEVIIHDKRYNK